MQYHNIRDRSGSASRDRECTILRSFDRLLQRLTAVDRLHYVTATSRHHRLRRRTDMTSSTRVIAATGSHTTSSPRCPRATRTEAGPLFPAVIVSYPRTFFSTDRASTLRLCVSRRQRKMYCGHACLCVCVCVCPRPYAHTTARTRM